MIDLRGRRGLGGVHSSCIPGLLTVGHRISASSGKSTQAGTRTLFPKLVAEVLKDLLLLL